MSPIDNESKILYAYKNGKDPTDMIDIDPIYLKIMMSM